MDRQITVTHNGVTYTGYVATIKSTRLGFEDHGILTASLDLSWEHSGVSVGGYCLDVPKDRDGRDYSRKGTAYGLDHIIRIIETVGVQKWEDLKGKHVIVLFEGGGSTWGHVSKGIAAIDADRVFIPAEHAAEWHDAEADVLAEFRRAGIGEDQ